MPASHSLLLAGFGFALALVVAAGATRIVLGHLRRNRILDVPNIRSSHAVPTPRGGGWGLVGAVVLASAVLVPFTPGNGWMTGLAAALVIAVWMSWRDDLGGLAVGQRLLGHYAASGCALAAVLASGGPLLDALAPGAGVPLWLYPAGLVVLTGYVWFVNLYNFMDGIDGISALQTLSVLGGIAGISAAAGSSEPVLVVYPMIVAGAAVGFLLWNWPPAKVFLGDVGSIPLGLWVGFFLLSFAAHGFVAPAVILPLYYIADATGTLAWRLARGEKVWQAHRSHWYQQSALAIGHRATVLVVLGGNAGLIALAFAALFEPLAATAAAMVWTATVLGVMSLCARHGSRLPAP